MENNVFRTRLLETIHALQHEYRSATKELEESRESREREFYKIWRELNSYQAGENPYKAVYLVGRCQTLLESFANKYRSIVEYEDARRKLEEYDMRRDIENG